MKKKKRRRVRTRIKVIGGLILGYIVLYVGISIYYHDKWYPNTVINGVDVSNMTNIQTQEAFDKKINDYNLEIIAREKKTINIKGKDIDLSVTYKDKLKKDFIEHKDDRSIWGFFKNYDHDINLKVKYNQDKLDVLLEESKLVIGDDNYKIEEAEPAHVEYDEVTKSGKIIAAKPGNEIDLKQLKKVVKNSLTTINEKIDLNKKEYANVFIEENISNKELEKQLKTYNTYLLNWINWDMGEGIVESITPVEIKDWLSVNKQGEVVLDKKEMSKWIEKFCLKYKTVGKTRKFTTHNGNVIDISGGDYGWRLDYDKIVDQVYDIIMKKNNYSLIENYLDEPNEKNIRALTTHLEPAYSNKGYKKDFDTFQYDWDTQNYSEIDLTEQRIYIYRNGQLAFQCITVSGLPTEKQDRITRTGTWYIKEKKTEKVLVGEDYKTPVKYWVRIMWTGTGYHALNRSDWANWSPELYKTRGSHGCLNLQEADAQILYDLVNINDPVFIHY